MGRKLIWVVVFTFVLTSRGIMEGEGAATGWPTDNATDALATMISRDLASGSHEVPVGPDMPLPVDTTTVPMPTPSISVKVKSRVNHEKARAPDDKRLKKLLGEISKVDLWEIFAFPDEVDEKQAVGEDVTVTDLFNHVRDIVKWDQVTSREIIRLGRDYLEDMLRDFLKVTDQNTSAFAKGGELLLMEALKLMPESFKEGVYLFSRAVEVEVGQVTRPDGRSISSHQNQKKLINPALGVTCPARIRELIYCWIYDIFEIGTELSQYVDLRAYIPHNFIESILNNL